MVISRERRGARTQTALPTWYLVVYGFGFAALGAAPVLFAAYDLAVVCVVLMALGVLVASSPGWLLPNLTGARLPDHESTLFPRVLQRCGQLAAIAAAGFIAMAVFLLLGAPVVALLCAVAGGVGTAWALPRVYASAAVGV